jgi:uncharacterized protein
MIELKSSDQGWPVKPQPLTDAECDSLTDGLTRFGGPQAMTLEMLDGFFTALICGPNLVLPSEYLPEIWGNKLAVDDPTGAEPTLDKFLSLVMRHWNTIADTLHSGEVYVPLMFEDANGVIHGNEWATGFLRGMGLHKEDWAGLVDDEDQGGLLVPIFALAHEHDPDPTMRPYTEPITPALRRSLTVSAASAVIGIYIYFETQRLFGPEGLGNPITVRRSTPKVGRNDPCPCGSAKKFKHCCGKPTVH